MLQPRSGLVDVNAICTGDGEFAFEEFLDAFEDDRDYTNTKNCRFRSTAEVAA